MVLGSTITKSINELVLTLADPSVSGIARSAVASMATLVVNALSIRRAHVIPSRALVYVDAVGSVVLLIEILESSCKMKINIVTHHRQEEIKKSRQF